MTEHKLYYWCPKCRSHNAPETFHADLAYGVGGRLPRDVLECPDCRYVGTFADWQHDHEAPTAAQLKRRQTSLKLES